MTHKEIMPDNNLDMLAVMKRVKLKFKELCWKIETAFKGAVVTECLISEK